MASVFRGCRFLMSPAAPAAQATVTKRKVNAITAPVPVSDALRRFSGADQVSRAGAVKLIWAHIKANGLQNPANKREILCDERLKAVLSNRDKVGMMEIAKLIGPHFIKK